MPPNEPLGMTPAREAEIRSHKPWDYEDFPLMAYHEKQSMLAEIDTLRAQLAVSELRAQAAEALCVKSDQQLAGQSEDGVEAMCAEMVKRGASLDRDLRPTIQAKVDKTVDHISRTGSMVAERDIRTLAEADQRDAAIAKSDRLESELASILNEVDVAIECKADKIAEGEDWVGILRQHLKRIIPQGSYGDNLLVRLRQYEARETEWRKLAEEFAAKHGGPIRDLWPPTSWVRAMEAECAAMREAVLKISTILEVPAAAYVPAISDAWKIADDALESTSAGSDLLARLQAAKALNKGWLKENGPGGWIDNLRLQLAEQERDMRTLMEALEKIKVIVGDHAGTEMQGPRSLQQAICRQVFTMFCAQSRYPACRG